MEVKELCVKRRINYEKKICYLIELLHFNV